MTLISTAEYSLRLVAPDGVPHVGRLDVWYGEEWRPVCAGRWGREEVTVACRQLGYEELVAFNNSKFLIASFPGSFPHSRHRKEGVRLISQVLVISVTTLELCYWLARFASWQIILSSQVCSPLTPPLPWLPWRPTVVETSSICCPATILLAHPLSRVQQEWPFGFSVGVSVYVCSVGVSVCVYIVGVSVCV